MTNLPSRTGGPPVLLIEPSIWGRRAGATHNPWGTSRRLVRAHAIDSRQHLTLLKGHGELSVAHGPLNLEMNQAIERNQGWDLALDEGIDFTDVPHHDRHEPKGATGIAPCEPCGNTDLLAIADPWQFVHWNLSRVDSLNHVGPLGSPPDQLLSMCRPTKIRDGRIPTKLSKLLI